MAKLKIKIDAKISSNNQQKQAKKTVESKINSNREVEATAAQKKSNCCRAG